MEPSPVKPYLAIGVLGLVVISAALIWKGGFFVSPEQESPEENTAAKPIPATISGVVTEKDARGRIVLDSKITGIVTQETKFFRTVEVGHGLQIYTRQPISFDKIATGQKVEFIPVRSSIEKNQETFELLLVTILRK